MSTTQIAERLVARKLTHTAQVLWIPTQQWVFANQIPEIQVAMAAVRRKRANRTATKLVAAIGVITFLVVGAKFCGSSSDGGVTEAEQRQILRENARHDAEEAQKQKEEEDRVARHRAELTQVTAPATDLAKSKPLSQEPTKTREEAAAPRSVKCCDGSISPSCTCGGKTRGCCSRHGGICGCE